MKKTHLLLLIILIEGYVVLACELLAIRELIPFVGSGTETIAIIISAVLLPLAFGYYFGGRQKRNIRARLINNILIALIFLSFGLSYLFLEFFFTLLSQIEIEHHLIQTALYALFFLAIPIFLIGQTVPLVSNYFGRTRLSKMTGTMLFFSTAGSFLGSIFSTLILMNTVGVHITVIFTLILLGLLIPLLSQWKFSFENMLVLTMLLWVILSNNTATMHQLNIVSNNSYNMIAIHKQPNGDKFMAINRSHSSAIDHHGNSLFPYIQYVEKIFIDPIKKSHYPHEILVIGAGGFTIGLNDSINHYTFIDIDSALKPISEKYFLKKPLTPNKQFLVESARAFVHHAKKHYDFIFVDTYTNIMAVPMETTTREFLLEIKHLLNSDGILVVNQIMSPDFQDHFSVRYNNVFESVFPVYTRQILGDYNPWVQSTKRTNLRNVLYMYYNRASIHDKTIYADDKNTYTLDRIS